MITASVQGEKFLANMQAIYQSLLKVWRITKLCQNTGLVKFWIMIRKGFFKKTLIFREEFLKSIVLQVAFPR